MTAVKSKKSSSKPNKQSGKKVSPPPANEQMKPRRLRLPTYRPFRLKRIRYPETLPSSWRISRQTLSLTWRNRGVFIGIALVYAVPSLLFILLGNALDVSGLKQQLGLQGGSQLLTGVSVFTTLLSASGGDSSNQATGVYQTILLVIVSLATIWAARQVVAGQTVRLRDAFYKGVYPIIPFILVLVVVLIQLIPFVIGSAIYVVVMSNGIAVGGLEQFLWTLLFAVLSYISIYLLCSSLFALYIVTLPDMTPVKALRTARQLVRYRKLQVFRKLFFLPLVLLVIGFIIMLPIILYVAGLAQVVFTVLVGLSLVLANAYMYVLYKELLV